MIAILALLLSSQPELRIQTGHVQAIGGTALSSQEKRLVTFGHDNRVIVWLLASGEPVFDIEVKSHVMSVALDDATNELRIASRGELLAVSLSTGSVLRQHKFALPDPNFSVIRLQGDRLIVGHKAWLELFDAVSMKSLGKIVPPDVPTDALVLSGTTVVFGVQRGFSRPAGGFVTNPAATYVVDVSTGAYLSAFDAATGAEHLKLSDDGRRLYGTSHDSMSVAAPKNLYVWDVASRKLLTTLNVDTGMDSSVSDYAELPGEQIMLLRREKAQVWSTKTSALVRELPALTGRGIGANRAGTLAYVVPGVFDLPTVRVFELPSTLPLRVLKQRVAIAYELKADGDGTIRMRSVDGVRTWDLARGRVTKTNEPNLRAELKIEETALFQPTPFDGLYLTTVRGELRSIDKQGKTALLRKLSSGDVPSATAFSPNKQTLAVGTSYGDVFLYDWKNKRPLAHLGRMPHESVRDVQFSPDGKQLLAANIQDEFVVYAAGRTHVLVRHSEYSNSYQHAGCFSPDGKRIFVASDSGEVAVFEDFTLKRKFTASQQPVASMTFTSDGRFIVTSSTDGAVRLWNPDTFALVATLVAVDDGEGLIYTPDYYFLSSKGAVSAVTYRRGGETFSFESFDLVFNRPDVVLARLGYARSALIDVLGRASKKRIARMGFDNQQLQASFVLPEARVINELPSVADSVSLSIEAKAPSGNLERVLVSVNDVPLSSVQVKAPAWKGNVSVALGSGTNRVQVSALDSRGMESKRQTFLVTNTSPAPHRVFVLAVGVSAYKATEMSLAYAAKDARDFANSFAGNGVFSSVQTKVIADADVTKENVLAARAFLAQAAIDDTVVVFFAGHGLLDEALDYYFATTDVDFSAPAGRGLAYADLEGLLDGLAARRRLLLMDTCHSGEVDKETPLLASAEKITVRGFAGRGVKSRGLGGQDVAAVLAEYFTDLRRGSGALVIASAGGAEFALESSALKNGVFTFALLDARNKGDRNKDGHVSVLEARDYVTDAVARMTNGQQRPSARRESATLDFDIY